MVCVCVCVCLSVCLSAQTAGDALFSLVLGVSGNSGWRWKEQRKASLEILRQLGLGKVTMADRIQEEVTQFLKALHDTQGAPVDVAEMTHVSISNNICSILFGQRFEYGDPAFARYLNIVADNLKTAGGERILGWWLVGWLVGWLVPCEPRSSVYNDNNNNGNV